MWRCGIGSDTHRLAPGRPLILGGVPIDFPLGAVGHSDADVLVHAVIDALFGAAALGDIGEHFPDTDPAYAGADSCDLLRTAVDAVDAAGYAIGNVDTIIVADKPKLKEYKPAIRSNLASVLGVAEDRVSIKAKTAEGLGPEGSGEAISAWATAMLVRRDDAH